MFIRRDQKRSEEIRRDQKRSEEIRRDQKRCVLYKLLISLRCMNESPTVAACVSTGSRRCVYKSFSY